MIKEVYRVRVFIPEKKFYHVGGFKNSENSLAGSTILMELRNRFMRSQTTSLSNRNFRQIEDICIKMYHVDQHRNILT